MEYNTKKQIRDWLKLSWALLFFWAYIPHLFVYLAFGNKRKLVDSDLESLHQLITISIPKAFYLLFLLHNDDYFRSLFYYRIGVVPTLLISWYRPGNKYFHFPPTTKIGPGFNYSHPYGTVLNAESIGANFHCIHHLTLGQNDDKRPIIGDDVWCWAGVSIVGGVRVGNNVTIGAGSVVVKDIPDKMLLLSEIPQR